MWEGAALCTSRGVGRCRPYAQGVPALLYRDTGTGNYEHCRLTCVTPEPQTYLRLPFHYAPFVCVVRCVEELETNISDNKPVF
jgi:hypothetical protein